MRPAGAASATPIDRATARAAPAVRMRRDTALKDTADLQPRRSVRVKGRDGKRRFGLLRGFVCERGDVERDPCDVPERGAFGSLRIAISGTVRAPDREHADAGENRLHEEREPPLTRLVIH